jgi:BirA family biotin operon repressor/biotin-[acetyl-CoA-carboxylase] ligase
MTIKWNVTVLGTAESTQDLVRTAALSGEGEGYAVQSLQQTKGRGRHGNEWDSPMGNLYLSVLLRPKSGPETAGQMAFVVALALSAAIDPYIDPAKDRKSLKWPNDILIGGLKISGILLETNLKGIAAIDYLIVGTGVNIFAPPEGRVGLDSLKTKPVYVNVFRDEYLAQLAVYYDLWTKKGFAPIREEWLKQAHGLGQALKVRLPEITYEGTFEGIDDSGALLLKADGKVRTFTAGEVHFG